MNNINFNGFSAFEAFRRKTKLLQYVNIEEKMDFGSHYEDLTRYQTFLLVNKTVSEYNSGLKIAAIAPHADDIELGCGATLARMIEQANAKLYYYVFITRKRGLDGKKICDNEARLTSCKKSFKFLLTGNSELTKEEELSDEFEISENGSYGKFRFFRDYSDRELYQNRESLLEELRKLQVNELNDVDIIFVPSFSDNHQDHQLISDVSCQIFRKQENIIFYKTPDSKIFPQSKFNPTIFVETSVETLTGGIYSALKPLKDINDKLTYVDVKLKLLSFFNTEKGALWYNNDAFLAHMKSNAYNVYLSTTLDKEKYAEAFEGIIRI